MTRPDSDVVTLATLHPLILILIIIIDFSEVSWIGCKFGHQIAPIALITNLVHASFSNLATRGHHLHWFKVWSSGGATCIGSKVIHQVESLALPHCLKLPYWHYQLNIELVA